MTFAEYFMDDAQSLGCLSVVGVHYHRLYCRCVWGVANVQHNILGNLIG